MSRRQIIALIVIAVAALLVTSTGQAGARTDGKVNINRASVDELVLIPGMTKRIAKRIIRVAKKRRYRRLRDLRRARVTRRQLRRFRRYLKVRGASDIHISLSRRSLKRKAPNPRRVVVQQVSDDDVDQLLKR